MNKKVLKLENKKAQKVKITNFMIERFQREEAFMKLRQPIALRADEIKMGKKDFNLEYRLEIFRLSEILLNGPEARAFNALKDELIKETAMKNEQIKKIEDKEQLSYSHPKVMELMNLESGLELEKLTLQTSILPANFTPEDMMITSWLVEYVDDTKGQK